MPKSIRFAIRVVITLAASLVPITQGKAALTYLSIPGIAGQDSTPGFPGAMAAQSVSVVPDGISIVKNVDAASPDIFGAVVAGTPLGTASLLVYNAVPSGASDATLLFSNVIASAYQVLGGGNPPREQDSFSSTVPAAIYMDLPGIPGEDSTFGHPGVMRIQSLSLAGNALTVVKLVDAASPAILLAVANGTNFSTGSMLFYDALPPTGQPAATLVFHDMLASSSQSFGSGNPPQVQDTFNFASISQPVPEPATIILLIVAATCVTFATIWFAE
jgi:type VI protein secretion system component Hcp